MKRFISTLDFLAKASKRHVGKNGFEGVRRRVNAHRLVYGVGFFGALLRVEHGGSFGGLFADLPGLQVLALIGKRLGMWIP